METLPNAVGLGFLLDRPEPGDNLPALRFRQAGPGGHAVADVPLAKKPLNVAVGCGTNPLTAEGWPLVAVAHGIGFMALQAVVAIDKPPSSLGFRIGRERIGAGM